MKYSEIANIQAAQTGLVQTLNGVAAHLSNNLIMHQKILVSNLEERLKQLQDENK